MRLLLGHRSDGYGIHYSVVQGNTWGVMFPYTTPIPAVHVDRLSASKQTWILAASPGIQGGPKLDELIAVESVKNLLQVLLSV